MNLVLVLIALSTAFAAVIPDTQHPIVDAEHTACQDQVSQDNVCLQTTGDGEHENSTLRIAAFQDPGRLGVGPNSQQYSGYLNVLGTQRYLFF